MEPCDIRGHVRTIIINSNNNNNTNDDITNYHINSIDNHAVTNDLPLPLPLTTTPTKIVDLLVTDVITYDNMDGEQQPQRHSSFFLDESCC